MSMVFIQCLANSETSGFSLEFAKAYLASEDIIFTTAQMIASRRAVTRGLV